MKWAWFTSGPLTEPFRGASAFSSVKWADLAELKLTGLREQEMKQFRLKDWH